MGGQPNGGRKLEARESPRLPSALPAHLSLGEGFGGKPQALTTYPVARSRQEQMITRVHPRAGKEEGLGPSTGGGMTRKVRPEHPSQAPPGAGVEGGALPWPPTARTRSSRLGADEQNPLPR